MRRISEVIDALEREVPGSIVEETDYIDRRTGEDPAKEENVYQPEAKDSRFDASERMDWEEDEAATQGNVPDPMPIFEIPPEVEGDVSEPLLSGESGEAIRQKIPLNGMDALGWYVTFHQRRFQWGIYVPVSGLCFMIDRVFGTLPCSLERKAQLAFHAIHRHEIFHFAADYMAAQWELALGKPCWVPSRALTNEKLGYDPYEEMLANAYMLRGFRYPSAATRERDALRLLKEFTKKQPEGYAEGSENIDRSSFELCWREHSHAFARDMDVSFEPPLEGFDHVQLLPGWPKIDWRYCPIHLVHDGDRLGIPPYFGFGFIHAIERVVETARFLKQLNRMEPKIAGRWETTKRQLSKSTAYAGLDFKKWEKGGKDVYSVRITRAVRAHLQLERKSGNWIAESIGSHKAMGHG